MVPLLHLVEELTLVFILMFLKMETLRTVSPYWGLGIEMKDLYVKF